MFRSAVERELTTIGEAISQLARIDTDAASALGDYRRIVNFRNVLVHGYSQVSDEVVWGILQDRLSDLHDRVSEALAPGS